MYTHADPGFSDLLSVGRGDGGRRRSQEGDRYARRELCHDRQLSQVRLLLRTEAREGSHAVRSQKG